MTPRGSVFLLGAAVMAMAQTSWGQRASSWRVFSVGDGLPESACVSITTTTQGKVIARHLSLASVSELDGYTVNALPLPEAGSSRVYQSPAGQLWTVTSQGLQEFRDGGWVVHPIPEIAAEFRSTPTRLSDPTPLYPVRQGLVILQLSDSLLEFNDEDTEHPVTTMLLSAGRTRLEKFSGMVPARDGGLWITGARGLLKVPGPLRNLKPETDCQDYPPPESLQLQNLRDPHPDEADGVTAMAESGTNHAKVLAHFDGKAWKVEAELPPKVRHAWCSANNMCWASSIDALFQWDAARHEWVENEEVSAREYYDVAIEPGGLFWLATADGLFRYSPLLWRSPTSVPKGNSPILALAADQERLWYVAGNVLRSWAPDSQQDYSLSAFPISNEQAPRALYSLKNGALLLAAGDQWFQFRPASRELNARPLEHRGGRLKALGRLTDGTLCFEVGDPGAAANSNRLETYDGLRFKALAEPAPDPSLGALVAAFSARAGDLWLSGEHGTAECHNKMWRTFVAADKTVPQAPLAFAELPDGRIWCATRDKVWEFDGRSWSAVRSGFDQINALLQTRDGSLWVASNNGLHRFFQGTWVENGLEEGLPSISVRHLYEDARGRLWAGASRGLSLYHPEADPDPPQTFVQGLPDKDRRVPEGSPVSLSFTGLDKWKQTMRLRLLYSYRLDERDWSAFRSENEVSFTDLPAGKHYFQTRAMDRNCNIDPKPARVEFSIILPWYKEIRLVAISLAGLTVALLFASLAFNRHRRLVRSYAEVEAKVADRTRELELANRALVHSQKMNALGTLAAGIAHDFNNILSIIKGSAQIIEDNLEDRRKVTIRVERINTAVEQGAGIVKAMLGFSRESGQQPALSDVNDIVEETLKLLGDRFLHEVQVNFKRAAGLPGVFCSRDFVQQILLNLIFNAAESMNHHKRVTLVTQVGKEPPLDLVLAPAKAASYVTISVRDFGCGISADILPRIFEPFFTTKALSVRRGTGLGLSMAYELAKKMEAGLAVESVVNQGSTFMLVLPVTVRNKSE